jgi:trehalose 6-phosphate synthase/phosphatase
MRIIIVSNRLPFSVIRHSDNTLQLESAVGGLATGMKSFVDSLGKSSKYVWVGWPGSKPLDILEKSLKKTEFENKIYPVYFSDKIKENYYDGFCNKTIWPLFHYFTSYVNYRDDYWNSYKEANRLFAKIILKLVKQDDIVFIHDYHLMLLPSYLRTKLPNQTIGFFLHIPFPTFEIYRMLPTIWRTEILKGLLGADLIGFHTLDYTQYFLNNVSRVLGINQSLGKLYLNGNFVKADTFPLGINYDKFSDTLQNQQIRRKIISLGKSIVNNKIILSVDRLDYTKGILNRLEGYELFLLKQPNWYKKVILILVLSPSRISVDYYQQMKKSIEEYVGKINGKYGSIDWTPIIYQYKQLNYPDMSALYHQSDIALITPLRDGMNLIAKEYVASHKNNKGVLILSETAGAAKELGEAIIINPNSKIEIANAIRTSLNMSSREQIRRMKIMNERLSKNTVKVWGFNFIKNLLNVKIEQNDTINKKINDKIISKISTDYKHTSKRLFILDYDGTLTEFKKDPRKVKPTNKLNNLLMKLAEDQNNEIVLVSGREKNILSKWFHDIPIGLAAEHGVFLKEKNSEWQSLAIPDQAWKKVIYPILNRYVAWLPGSFIEEKKFSLAWHYRKIDDRYISDVYEKNLIEELVSQTANSGLQILSGSKVVEIKSTNINKGTATLHWLEKNNYDFILGIGDDLTDEDLFSVLPVNSYSIKVGMNQTKAKYIIENPLAVRTLLETLLVNAIN